MRGPRQLCQWLFNTSELPKSLAEMLLGALASASKYKIACFSKPASFTVWPPFGLRCLDTVLKNGYCKRMRAKLLQLCLTLYDPMDCSLPDSSVHGILQARILKWVAISSSSGYFQPKDWTHVSCSSWIAGRFFTTEPSGKYLGTLEAVSQADMSSHWQRGVSWAPAPCHLWLGLQPSLSSAACVVSYETEVGM